jgi:hypothetical protein
MRTKKNVILPSSADPIGDLLSLGWTYPRLASEWGLHSDSAVRKMRTFTHIPRAPLAAKMAATFGWGSAGDVVNVWLERQQAAQAVSA